MSKNLNPDICEVSGFDFSTVPKLGPNLEGLGDDITGYLCNILKLSQREDLDPVLREATPYDNSVWISALTGMQGVGDPRLSMGELMTVALERYLKPLSIQLQILQEGCQITNGVLCDAEGKEVPFYGKCETPDTEMFTYDSITNFVSDVWLNALDKHADNFINFLQTKYLDMGWSIELFALADGNLEQIKSSGAAPIFYVKLFKATESKPVYFKYYFDRKNYVSNALGKPIIIKSPRELQRDFFKSFKSEEGPDIELIDAISGPLWPEKIIDNLSEVTSTYNIIKPHNLYVDISFSSRGNAQTDMFINNGLWDGTLPSQISSGNKLISYPNRNHISPVSFGEQNIIISPKDNGSFCVVLFDYGVWKDWNWKTNYKGQDGQSSHYNINIILKSEFNKFKTITKDINITKIQRSYNGASGTCGGSSCKISYSQGYGSQKDYGSYRVTCYVITDVWSLFNPELKWI